MKKTNHGKSVKMGDLDNQPKQEASIMVYPGASEHLSGGFGGDSSSLVSGDSSEIKQIFDKTSTEWRDDPPDM